MRHFIFVLLACLSAVQAQAQSFPARDDPYVNDFADLMSADQEEVLRGKLIELQDERGIAFTVLTIASMTDYGHTGAIEPFATDLFNHWGVGHATRNDGVMLLVAHLDRSLRIEVGSGYGDSKNDAMAAIIDTKMIPLFRDEDYALGIDRGVDAIIHEVSGVWPGEFQANPLQKIWNRLARMVSGIGDWIAVAYAFVAGLAYRLYRRWKRNKPRICPKDGHKMRKLGEAQDDAFLKEGEQVEERLKSVDYDVWVCDTCDHRTVESYKSWISRYGACRSCGYKTLDGDTTIVKAATTSTTGQKRIDYHCKNCDDRYKTFVTIPRKTESSSSSSGGSSGGGSSSGGGASGSW